MSKPSTTIVAGAAGAIAVIAMVIGIVWFCKFQCKKLSNRNSETGSSDPSALGKLFYLTCFSDWKSLELVFILSP